MRLAVLTPIGASGNAIRALEIRLRVASSISCKEWKELRVRRLDDERLSSLEEISRGYEMSLMGAEEAVSYLLGRGLSTASMDKFRLGLVVDPPKEHKAVAGRIAIPTIKRAGVVGFKFRCIREECADGCIGHGKYMTYESQSMYNVQALDNDRGIIAITEGEFDAMILDGECGIPAVGLVGINAWRPHFGRLLRDFSKIWVFADNDAGKQKNVGADFGAWLVDQFDQAQLVSLPLVDEGQKSDVTSVYVDRGRDFVRDLIGM